MDGWVRFSYLLELWPKLLNSFEIKLPLKVFGKVYKALHSEMESFDSQNQDVLMVQDLIKSELTEEIIEKDL